MAITGNIQWQNSYGTSPAPDAGHGTISLGTVMVELSVLAAAIRSDVRGLPLSHYERLCLLAMRDLKPYLYQKTQSPFIRTVLKTTSENMICQWLKQLDSALYGASQGNNSSTPTTQPTQTPENATSPATKPVILINKYRGQNTSTKEKPQKSSPSYAGLSQAIGELGW